MRMDQSDGTRVADADLNLIVRDNLDQTQDDFGQGDVRRYHGEDVECGSDASCNCTVDAKDTDLPGKWFRIRKSDKAGRHRIEPAAPNSVFLNKDGAPLTEARELVSGDMIRVGHYTFRYQRIRQGVAVARKSDLISTLAKVLLAVVFATELCLVYWLPRQLQKSQLLAAGQLRHKVAREVDMLRAQSQLNDNDPPGSLPFMARGIANEELGSLSDYLRRYEENLSAGQWRQIRSQLHGVEALLKQADTGEIGAPMPELQLNAAVARILEKHDVDIPLPNKNE